MALLAGISFAAKADAAPTAITEFPVDVGHSSDLEHLVVGPDGNVWFRNRWWPEGSHHALIDRMDAAGNVDEFDEGLSKYSSPRDLVAGPDGNVWFADNGSGLGGAAIGRITSDGEITRFSSGLGGSRPTSITVGPEANLWFTALGDSRKVGFATTDGTISGFTLPGRPRDLVAGPDGNIWFTYGGVDVAPAIGRVVRDDGGTTITLFHSGLDAESWPYEIVAGPGGYLWFSDPGGTTPAIGRVSTDGEIKEFSAGLSPGSGLPDIAAGPDGNVWFATGISNAVGRVTPQGQITEFGAGEISDPRHIAAGPDGNMWFTFGGGTGSGVGKVSPSGAVTQLYGALGPSAYPSEIVSGRNGELWFIASGSSDPAIGRIIPGDDSPPPTVPPVEPTQPLRSLGQFQLRKRSIQVSRSGRAVLRFVCQSSLPCVGSLRLIVFRRGWRAGRTIGTASFSVGAWESAGVRVRISRSGRKLLRQSRRALRASLHVNSPGAFPPQAPRLKLRFVRRVQRHRVRRRHVRRVAAGAEHALAVYGARQ